MKKMLNKLFVEFFNSEKTSGIILIACTFTSIFISNSYLGENYLSLWHASLNLRINDIFLLELNLEQWINDGLMAIFFLLIGLEIKREIYVGELSSLKSASLPIFAAIGGMVTPALVHYFFNHGTATQAGAGIPMATDIAFALGVLALLGNKVPVSLKIFLSALAIIDDLGAILVIALFYQKDFSFLYFLLTIGVCVGLLIINRLNVNRLSAYVIPGVIMWYFMLLSGIHATIAGVLLAVAIPFRSGDENSPSYKLQHFLHRPVAFIIMPLFALANTGIVLAGNWMQGLITSNGLGISAGLFLGKPLGIFLFSLLAVKLGLSRLPEEVHWNHIVGAGFLGGIGFTMSIFITLLAFGNPDIAQSSKVSILLSSFAAGFVGFLVLKIQSAKVPN